MIRLFGGCVIGVVLVLLLAFCGFREIFGAEVEVRIGIQRLESNSESFRPKVDLFYSFQLGYLI